MKELLAIIMIAVIAMTCGLWMGIVVQYPMMFAAFFAILAVLVVMATETTEEV